MTNPTRERLPFLDGIRGFAALYVVLFHAMVEAHVGGRSPSGWPVLAFAVLRFGHYAVDVFIVLSGFSLMRPVARDPESQIPGGVAAYFGRRARRILPAYYASLAFCGLAVALIPVLRSPAGVCWDIALPAGGAGTILSHLALVQNLSPAWLYKLNPPTWTVATEWQIYALFPALLLVRRKLGPAATVAVAFATGWSIAAVGPSVGNLALVRLCPWFLGLFALGMAAADARLSRSSPAAWGVAAAVAVLPPWLVGRLRQDNMIADPVVGALTATLLFRLAGRLDRGESTRLTRLLGSGPAGWLGSVSYSLYLTHFPILAAVGAWVRSQGFGHEARMAVMLGLAAPLCVLVAWPFARAFERPFGRRSPGSARVAATSTPHRRRTAVSSGRGLPL